MKFETEKLPHCTVNLKVEVEPGEVEAVRAKILFDLGRQARVPGYRPGKVPSAVLEARYKGEIGEELRRILASRACRDAIEQEKLDVLAVTGVEDFEIGLDGGARFVVALVTSPEFELPQYKGIELKVQSVEVTERIIDQVLEGMRERFADYRPIEGRALAMGDFAVIDYRSTLDGVPVEEAVPKAGRFIGGQEGFWLRMEETGFLPGFCAELVGMTAGEERTFSLELASPFPVEELAGKRLEYAVSLKEIKERVLRELDDSFAELVLGEGGTIDKLREQVRRDAGVERLSRIEAEKRRQVMAHLTGAVECELPVHLVRNETRRVMQDIVRENQARGVDEELLKEHRDEIVTNASRGARERLKGSFILERIAAEEGIEATREEVADRIAELADRFRMSADKVRRELEKRDAMDQLREEIVSAKTLDFLVANATVEIVVPADEPATP